MDRFNVSATLNICFDSAHAVLLSQGSKFSLYSFESGAGVRLGTFTLQSDVSLERSESKP